MHNRLHLACLKMTEVWIMSDLQPIQEVLIIEIIEKCTPCRIYMEKQLSQTIAVFSVQLSADFSLLNSQCLPSMLDFFFCSFIQSTMKKQEKLSGTCVFGSARRETKWQRTCLSRVNTWCEHICQSLCCKDSVSPQTRCVQLTIPGNRDRAPHLPLAMWQTPAWESNNDVKLLTSGRKTSCTF